MSANKNSLLPFGSLLGYAPGGVPAYSSDYDSVDVNTYPNRQSFMHYHEGVYTGFKWQCVEFARRWLLVNCGYVFEDVAMAYDIFRLSEVKRMSDGEKLPLKAFANGSLRHPVPGCMLIWNEGGEFTMTGHVAIITEVFPDKVRIAEQNVHHQSWSCDCDYSRELPARVSEDGGYWIQCSFATASVLGWMIQTEDDSHAVQFNADEKWLLPLRLKELKADVPANKVWLNVANADEAAYVTKMKGSRLALLDADRYKYFCISRTAQKNLKRATNELHHLFLHATDYVLKNPHLLEKFNIPEVLWPRLQQSWSNRRNHMITGRFDFCMTEQGIKVFEYNCDSAALYMECGKVQGRWAEFYGCSEGEDPGAQLLSQLTRAWQDSHVDSVLHIMLDHDDEELYHALFMQEAISAAGIRSKLIHGTEGLQFDSKGNVLDADGEPILWVWKTWAWETALDQLRIELSATASMERLKAPGQTPQLMDVLFQPDTLVFEPLWTLITSNKALLPVLWELFPGQANLLESHFDLTDSLKEKGYVVKPIVGRCGHNISLVDQASGMLSATQGDFEAQGQVYQALWKLPDIGGFKTQVSTFCVDGLYAGAGVRTDASLIITADSQIMPLRIIDDAEFLHEQ